MIACQVIVLGMALFSGVGARSIQAKLQPCTNYAEFDCVVFDDHDDSDLDDITNNNENDSPPKGCC